MHPGRAEQLRLGHPEGSDHRAGDAVDALAARRLQAALPVLRRTCVRLGVNMTIDNGKDNGWEEDCDKGDCEGDEEGGVGEVTGG